VQVNKGGRIRSVALITPDSIATLLLPGQSQVLGGEDLLAKAVGLIELLAKCQLFLSDKTFR
jgi:hypothetical protein